MIHIIYFLIALLATTLGAVAGIGGGVIIKPTLDLLNHYDVATISILSSFTVLSMAIVSSIKQLKEGFQFQGRLTVLLVIGATIGGICGKVIFTWFINTINNDLIAKNIQSILLTCIFILILYMINKKIHQLNIKNEWVIIGIGLILGLIAAFFGIGGGPLNVAILSIFFAMDPKIAASHSILIILFSQMSKLVSIGVTTGFSMYHLNILYSMIGGGIMGGLVGSFFKRKLDNTTIKRIFNIILVGLIVLNIYNTLG